MLLRLAREERQSCAVVADTGRRWGSGEILGGRASGLDARWAHVRERSLDWPRFHLEEAEDAGSLPDRGHLASTRDKGGSI